MSESIGINPFGHDMTWLRDETMPYFGSRIEIRPRRSGEGEIGPDRSSWGTVHANVRTSDDALHDFFDCDLDLLVKNGCVITKGDNNLVVFAS